MADQDLISFAANRIQEKERLPDIGQTLADQIKLVGEKIALASDESMRNVSIEDFIFMLEGVPAQHSLQVVVEMINSPQGEVAKEHLLKTRASITRFEFYEKIQAFAELFTPLRVARIAETGRYINDGWGWGNV